MPVSSESLNQSKSLSTDSPSQIRNLPIGIFDSGVGGLTVYKALHEHLPNEHFVYLGDTARVPYGTKSLSTVERYAIENALFLASHGIKLLVVACNTASALALPKIRERVGLETIGVIGPGARKALRVTANKENPRIAVIATEATVQSNAYLDAIKRVSEKAEVIQAACPLFVPLAEEGWAEEEETFMIARKYLKEIVAFKPDALILGCTHYPILKNVIQKIVGESVKLIDSGEACAEEVKEILIRRNLTNPNSIKKKRRICDDLDHFYVTDAAKRFAKVAERFLGAPPIKLEEVEIFGTDKLEAKHELQEKR
ncbi:MAG: glutamate racemase [Acidobacteria bacterium]|jgi:glutamate racemase|nr:MAG: glutamate racemase [Acidobacteriota bacterium]